MRKRWLIFIGAPQGFESRLSLLSHTSGEQDWFEIPHPSAAPTEADQRIF